MSLDFTLCITGSNDFVRRMSASARGWNRSDFQCPIRIAAANSSEARAVIFTERPNLLVVDVGLKSTRQDLNWIRGLLTQLRDRFQKNIHIAIAVTAPEKFCLAGSLLFADDESIAPSGLVDSFLASPPVGVLSSPSLELQLKDCASCVLERLLDSVQPPLILPALWEDGWVPVMCDPVSRDVWMRWLPRYARYVNENPIIIGPTGSGKTRLATAVHRLSGRIGPFVSITPRDFSSTELVQAELFGAVAGAYTGAVEKWGLVRRAEKGTLFIDELQSIDRDLQGKLITFIENKTYRRVGEAESHQADVRFIFATNRSLEELVRSGLLRDDFAYRLERLQIELPALEERRLDIAAGISFSLCKVLRERAKPRSRPQGADEGDLEGLTSSAYGMLFGSSWPGNLRQLENTVAKLIELADMQGLRLITRECVETTVRHLLGRKEPTPSDIFAKVTEGLAGQLRSNGINGLQEIVELATDLARIEALATCGGDPAAAAALIADSPEAMRLFAAARSS